MRWRDEFRLSALLVGVWFVAAVLPIRADTPPEIVAVVVARQYIPAGTVIKEPNILFKLVRYVKGDEPRQAITDPKQLRGAVLARTLAEDQPVKQLDLSTTAAPTSPIIPPGMRAVAVPIDAGAETAFPKARVNVTLMQRNREAHDPQEMVLKNVTVLAVDRKLDAANGPVRAPIVTFLVTPDQAQDLIKAQNDGLLRIRLRAIRE